LTRHETPQSGPQRLPRPDRNCPEQPALLRRSIRPLELYHLLVVYALLQRPIPPRIAKHSAL